MSNYKENGITGSSYIRAGSINISNPLRGEKVATFYEEKVIDIGDDVIIQGNGMPISQVFNESTMNEVFHLLNPLTGEPVGVTMSFQEVYVALYSLYLHIALKRDNAANVPPEPQANENVMPPVVETEPVVEAVPV